MICTSQQEWDFDSLKALPTPPQPSRCGGYWHYISHHDLLYDLLVECQSRGWHTENLRVSLSRGHANMAAAVDVKPDFWSPHRAFYSLGVLNSNCARFRLRITGGLRLWEEDVGVTLFMTTLGRHTLGNAARLRQRLPDALGLWAAHAIKFNWLMGRLKHFHFTNNESSKLLVRAGEAGLLPWSRVGQANESYRCAGDKSAWSLLLHFAQQAKRSPAIKQMPQTYGFSKVLRDYLNLP